MTGQIARSRGAPPTRGGWHRRHGVPGRALRRLAAAVALPTLLMSATGFVATDGVYEMEKEVRLPGESILPSGSIYPVLEYSPMLSASSGTLLAAWNIGTWGNINWAYSLNHGLTWLRGSQILPKRTIGNSGEYEISGPPAVAIGPAGRFNVCFRHGKAGYGGSLEMATFADSAGALRLVRRSPSSPPPPGRPEFIGTILPRLVFDPERGRMYETYSHSMSSPVDPDAYDFHIAFTMRTDSTWTPPVLLSGDRCNGPRLALGPDEELFLVWKDMANMNRTMIRGCRSKEGGRSFGPQFTVGESFDLFQVSSGYEGGPSQGPAPPCFDPFVTNYPSLAVDRSHGARRGTVYVVWTHSIRGSVPAASRVRSEVEPNNNAETANLVSIGDDIHGSCPGSDLKHDLDFFAFDGVAGQTISISGTASSSAPYRSGFGLRLECRYVSGARKVGVLGWISTTRGHCEPIIYTLPATGRYGMWCGADDRYGFSYTMSLRTITPDGRNPARDMRDVVLSSSSDGGVTWTPPQVVNDDPPYSENLLPEVAVDGLGGVHVSWYDRRDDRECGAGANVYVRYSQDGGLTFFPSERLSDSTSVMDWSVNDHSSRLYLGDYMSLVAEGTDLYAAWTQTKRAPEESGSGNAHDINFRHFRVNPDIRVTDSEASTRQGVVHLSWDVTLPDFVWKFRVSRRSTATGAFELLGEVSARERSGTGYAFVDSTALGGVEAVYRIEGIRADEQPLPPRDVAVRVSPRTAAPVWRSVAPNPSSGSVALEIDSPGSPAADVRVFDARGGLVRTLHRGPLPDGVERMNWDGLGEAGRPLPGGVYFLELRSEGHRDVRKVVLVRRS